MGTVRRLREFNPLLTAVSVQPDSPFHGLEGLKHMATAMVPSIYDPRVADRNLEVETEAAYSMVKRLAQEGVLVGISAGAALVACEQLAREEATAGRRATIVTVLPDSADKYLSERFWEEM
jgi:cysteine synthase B